MGRGGSLARAHLAPQGHPTPALPCRNPRRQVEPRASAPSSLPTLLPKRGSLPGPRGEGHRRSGCWALPRRPLPQSCLERTEAVLVGGATQPPLLPWRLLPGGHTAPRRSRQPWGKPWPQPTYTCGHGAQEAAPSEGRSQGASPHPPGTSAHPLGGAGRAAQGKRQVGVGAGRGSAGWLLALGPGVRRCKEDPRGTCPQLRSGRPGKLRGTPGTLRTWGHGPVPQGSYQGTVTPHSGGLQGQEETPKPGGLPGGELAGCQAGRGARLGGEALPTGCSPGLTVGGGQLAKPGGHSPISGRTAELSPLTDGTSEAQRGGCPALVAQQG